MAGIFQYSFLYSRYALFGEKSANAYARRHTLCYVPPTLFCYQCVSYFKLDLRLLSCLKLVTWRTLAGGQLWRAGHSVPIPRTCATIYLPRLFAHTAVLAPRTSPARAAAHLRDLRAAAAYCAFGGARCATLLHRAAPTRRAAARTIPRRAHYAMPPHNGTAALRRSSASFA